MDVALFVISFFVVLCGIWKMPNENKSGPYQLIWILLGGSGMFIAMYLRHLGW